MRDRKILNTIVESVAHWHWSAGGPMVSSLALGDERVLFSSLSPDTPALTDLKAFIGSKLLAWQAQTPLVPTVASLQRIQEDLAQKWLSYHSETIEWGKLLNYMEELRYRTYENAPVSLNLIIDPEEKGEIDITEPVFQKLLDPLAISQNTYLLVDGGLRFIDYGEIEAHTLAKSADRRFVPLFIRPLFSNFKYASTCIVSLTARGDLIICGHPGMLAAYRKGRWHVYDSMLLRESFMLATGSLLVGTYLLELAFSLSYRRRGALLIYDPDHTVLHHVLNQECIVRGGDTRPGATHTMLAPSISTIKIAMDSSNHPNHSLLCEIASVDGAVIYDEEGILAFGALIESHPLVKSGTGARTAAAESSFWWGGFPTKVSADGDIQVFFANERVFAAYSGPKAEGPTCIRFM